MMPQNHFCHWTDLFYESGPSVDGGDYCPVSLFYRNILRRRRHQVSVFKISLLPYNCWGARPATAFDLDGLSSENASIASHVWGLYWLQQLKNAENGDRL